MTSLTPATAMPLPAACGEKPDARARVDGGSIGRVSSEERRLPVPGSDGEESRASLRAGVVYRDPGPWSPAVLALLRHLERAGFTGAPQVAGGGFAADGREMVRYIEGSSPHPRAWPESAVGEVGALMAGLHAAAATFVPAPARSGSRGSAAACPDRGRCSGTATPARGTSWPATASQPR